jgi:hypothetical protein
MKSPLERLREIRAARASGESGSAVEPLDAELAEVRQDWAAVKLYSRLLGLELWLARDQRAADELLAEGVAIPIVLLSDVPKLAGKPVELLRAVLAGKAALPGARWVQ